MQGRGPPPGTATRSPMEAEGRLDEGWRQGSRRADIPFGAAAPLLGIRNVSEIRTDFCHVPQTGELELLFLILWIPLFHSCLYFVSELRC